ncbi:putative ABC exporter domain-containing protein [Vallitalea guaymasensis]|uniref:putative ABC exporter domain-containing protein n=1 Tax=Vallitalea guaymasensis TaxID=1185412 RepID=UPI000DE55F79|nr:putative ABC exporter domain-containing protein [Vallitalea guaymasensis]
MKPLFYIMKRSFVNRVKEIVKKPAYLIFYIFLILFIGGFFVISFIMPSQNTSTISKISFELISAGSVLIITYFQLNQGIEKGNSFFRQSDVNFVFTAPISRKKVLIYGFIKEMLTTLLIIFFLIFQIPNLKNHYPISNVGIIVLILSVVALFFCMSLISLILYSITSQKNSYRVLAKRIINGIYIAFISWFTITLVNVKDFLTAANNVFESKIFNSIPVVGWFKIVLSYSTKELDGTFYMNLIFILITIVILMLLLYNLNSDYYEDVLGATLRKEKQLAAKRAGKSVREIKADKVKKVKGNFGSGGAKAIFYKHMMEYRKNGMFFISKETIGIVAFGIASKFFMEHSSLRTVLYFSIYMLLIYSMQGKWMEEMKMHYIYLIPAGSIEKIFFGTLANHLKNFVDGLILFAISGFMFKADIITILLSAITYTTFGALFVYNDVLARRLFGSAHSKVFRLIMKLLIVLVFIVPGIAGGSIIELIVLKGSPYATYFNYLIMIAYNITLSFLLLLSGRKIFEISEL